MIRSGSKDSMMNIDVHHNSDDIDQTSKVKHAGEIAKFIQKQLKIPNERYISTLTEILFIFLVEKKVFFFSK